MANYFDLCLTRKGNTTEGWHQIPSFYSNNDIDKIKDPEGASDRLQVTSIPSPFARIHLVEDAFEEINKLAEKNLSALDDSKYYNRLVSETWDVGELFFRFEIFSKQRKLDIVKWNLKKDLKELGNTSLHEIFGRTLELFLEQDKNDSNFNRIDNFYFIEANHRTVVGGTSPSTLFFSSANDLSFLDIKPGSDTLFDDDYCPLHRRDPSFQRYIHLLFKIHKELNGLMPRIANHLEVSAKALEKHNSELYHKLMADVKGSYGEQEFREEFKPWGNAQFIEIFPNIPHRKFDITGGPPNKSDFLIKTEFELDKVPMALQDGFQKKLTYLNGKWNPETKVPAFVEEDIMDRIPPGQAFPYPYLTVSDFLEDVIIQVPYAIDHEAFFNGNPTGFELGNFIRKEQPEEQFLLPLKPAFFEYFPRDILMEKTPEGDPIFRMRKVGAEGVRVELRIPIQKGEFVLFERFYSGTQVDHENNRGAISRWRFSLNLMPFMQGGQNRECRVGLIYMEKAPYQLFFWKKDEDNTVRTIEPRKETQRSNLEKHASANASSKYYLLHDKIDFIQVGIDNQFKCLILPLIPEVNPGPDSYTVAIDFGTTNTHVELAKKGHNPEPLSIGEEDSQIQTLHQKRWALSGSEPLNELIVKELIPRKIGEGELHDFPQRTAVSETIHHSHVNSLALGDICIPFSYEKIKTYEYELITTNLKWSKLSFDKDGKVNSNRVQKFLETLLLMVKNKILLNGGDPKKTKLIWFYPSSMSKNNRNQYEQLWRKVAKEVFNSEEKLAIYSESEVPIYLHREKIAGFTHPVLNIDIGGGTTDVVVYEQNEPKFLTSFRFAGNAVFGDAYETGMTSQRNGFVEVLAPQVAEEIKNISDHSNDDGIIALSEVYRQLREGERKGVGSAEMMAFFFSLEQNQSLLEKGHSFPFSKQLAAHEEFNIVFYLFWTSICYHIAKMMKALNFGMPRNISLSGNGSKIIQLLDQGPKLKSTAQLAKLIFMEVYGAEEYNDDGLEIIQGENPKQATCKGGILKNRLEDGTDGKQFDQIVLLGDNNTPAINPENINYDKYSFKYNKITQTHKEGVLKEYEAFLELALKKIPKKIQLSNHFGMSLANLENYHHILLKDRENFLENGLADRRRLNENLDNENIEETFFFYPLIGTLYRLTQHIAQM